MRALAYLVTLVLLAAALWSGQELRRAIAAPLPPAPPAPAAAAVTGPAGEAPAPPRDWPALFGRYAPPEPQPPRPPEPVAEPQPPASAAPPLDSLGYRLKGVVSDGTVRWAIVSHPSGELLLRVGDMLGAGYRVTAIDARGLWVSTGEGDEPVLLGFESAPDGG